MRRIVSVLLSFALVSGCAGDRRKDPPAVQRAPIRERPSGPVTLNGPTPPETQQCFADLSRAQVRFSPLPDRDFGSGCVVMGAVQLIDIGVPVSGLKSMRCPLARAFVGWLHYAVAPAAKQILGSELVRVESFGTYACRAIIGGATPNRMSEHGLGNAVDIGGFILADGRKVRIEGGWRSDDPKVRDFLRTIHASACRRFRTVLSPDYNAAHYNHLHLDMGRGPFCR